MIVYKAVTVITGLRLDPAPSNRHPLKIPAVALYKHSKNKKRFGKPKVILRKDGYHNFNFS